MVDEGWQVLGSANIDSSIAGLCQSAPHCGCGRGRQVQIFRLGYREVLRSYRGHLGDWWLQPDTGWLGRATPRSTGRSSDRSHLEPVSAVTMKIYRRG